MSEIWRAVCCRLSADSCPLTSAPMTQKANPVTLTSYGQVPLGLEGSGAFRCPGSIVRVLRTERWVRPTERAGSEGSLKCRLRRQENHTTALRARKCIPPLGGWRHHLVRWEACHWILSRLRLPANPVPLPPQAGVLWMFSNGAMSLQESMEQFILPPGWGKVRRSRIRGSRAAANHQNANQAL